MLCRVSVSILHNHNSHEVMTTDGICMKKNNRKFKPRTIYTRNFAKYNEANYKADLICNLDWKNVTHESNINKAWDIFNGGIHLYIAVRPVLKYITVSTKASKQICITHAAYIV